MANCLCGKKGCLVAGPPGSSSLLSDKTLAFWNDPLEYVESTARQHGGCRVLQARLALKQTLIIAEHRLTRDFLNSGAKDFYNGLKENYSALFGHSIMFAGQEEAEKLRKVILPLFDHNSIKKYEGALEGILSDWSKGLATGSPCNFYEEFKQLSLAYNLEVFLGVHHQTDRELLHRIRDLSSVHWHGAVSIPLKFSLPWWGSSGYSRGMEAKQKLMYILKERIHEGSDQTFVADFLANNQGCMTDEILLNHFLLFSCALIPKGVGALLSMLLELGGFWCQYVTDQGEISEDDLEIVLLETARMFPPFIGGLRIADKETSVGRFHIPKGGSVHFSLLGAMRDPTDFENPNQFIPERWRESAVPRLDRKLMLGFGAGSHDCVGRHFSWHCVKRLAKFTIKTWKLTWNTPALPQVKYLPVLRPVQPTIFTLTPR